MPHDTPKKIPVPTQPTQVLIEDLLEDSGTDDGRNIPTMEEISEPTKEKEPQATFNCSNCPFGFKAILDLKSHIELIHTKNDEAVAQKSQKMQQDFECLKCKKIIRTNIGIVRHSELYCEQCDECSSEFCNNVGPTIHKQSIHEKIKFPCHMCSDQLTTLTSLMRHVIVVSWWACPVSSCGGVLTYR